MRSIWIIAKRELGSYFTSPVAYVFLVIFLLLTGFFTFTAGQFFERGEASLGAFFGWHPWLYLVLVPAVGMRLWAEERRAGTLELLLTMPITPFWNPSKWVTTENAATVSMNAGLAQRTIRSVTGLKPARIRNRHATTARINATTWLRVIAEVMQVSAR